MDAITFDMAINGIKAAASLSKELLALKIRGDIKGKVSEIDAELVSALQHATTAYSSQMELTKRVHDLEEEVMRLEDWNVNKQDYELKSIGGTSFAYMMKESAKTSEPKHWLCQPCFDSSKKSVLQGKERPAKGRGKFWACNSCGTDILVMEGVMPEDIE